MIDVLFIAYWRWLKTTTYMQHAIRLNLRIGMQHSQHIRYSAPHHLTDNWNDRNCDTTFVDEHRSRDHGPTERKKKEEKNGFRHLYDVFVSFQTHGQPFTWFVRSRIKLTRWLIGFHLMFSSIASWSASQTSFIFKHIIWLWIDCPIMTFSRFSQSWTLSKEPHSFIWIRYDSFDWIYLIHFDEAFVQT